MQVIAEPIPRRSDQLAEHSARPIALEPPSVVVLTKDEEVNIEACLQTLSFSDDIVVLDSYSTDRTVEMARRHPNVRVVQRHFDTEWKQRNYGLQDIPYKHPWVYICDADERVPQGLVDEMMQKINTPSLPYMAFRLRYKNMYLGKWIKHASGYPVWLIRLVRPEYVSYEVRETNIHPIVRGPIGELRGHFIHYSFNSGLKRWFQKHNFYSTREAREGVKVRREGMPSFNALRSDDPIIRRRALKNLSYSLTGRAIWRFADTYLIRGGWLDGTAGFHYSLMISMYEYWIELKMRELEQAWTDRTDLTVERFLAEVNPA
jgi:glycosyltransferase involved in cell wall biosynthesis